MPEEKIGKVSKFFAKPMVAAVEVTAKTIKVGDTLHFMGFTTDFTTQIASMQEEHQSIQEAGVGKMVGIKVPDRVREGDEVFLVS